MQVMKMDKCDGIMQNHCDTETDLAVLWYRISHDSCHIVNGEEPILTAHKREGERDRGETRERKRERERERERGERWSITRIIFLPPTYLFPVDLRLPSL